MAGATHTAAAGQQQQGGAAFRFECHGMGSFVCSATSASSGGFSLFTNKPKKQKQKTRVIYFLQKYTHTKSAKTNNFQTLIKKNSKKFIKTKTVPRISPRMAPIPSFLFESRTAKTSAPDRGRARSNHPRPPPRPFPQDCVAAVVGI